MLLAPPRQPVCGDGQLVRLSARAHEDERGFLLLELNFIGRRQDFNDLIAVAERGGKVVIQMVAEHAIHGFGVQGERSRAQLRREVLLVLEEQPTIGRIMEIPRASRELI